MCGCTRQHEQEPNVAKGAVVAKTARQNCPHTAVATHSVTVTPPLPT